MASALKFIQPRETERMTKARQSRATQIVRWLRLGLPVLAGVLLLTLVLWPMFNKKLMGYLVKKTIPDLVVENLHYTSLDSKNQPYTLTADKATRSPSQTDLYNLEKPSGDIKLTDGRTLHGEAQKGLYDMDAHTLHLSGTVRLLSSDDRTFQSEDALVDLDASSAKGDQPVTLSGAFGTIQGTGFELFDSGNRVIIKSPARAILNIKTKNDAAQATNITANDGFTWQADQKLYTAQGDVKATQDGATVEADTLTAHAAAESPNANPDRLTATGNVRIGDERQHVTGDQAEYETASQKATVTGKKLAYENDKVTITARDSLEYRDDTKTATAHGHVVAVDKEGRRLQTDLLIAQFDRAAKEKNTLQTVTAIGHVVITVRGDVSRGDRAVYDASRKIATLTGHVRIERADGTKLSGAAAEINFATNRSSLMNPEKGGRVRALFAPKAAKPKK